MDNVNAAENLEGIILKSGWLVEEIIEKKPGATGSFFSVCYQVVKNGETCFLKAFNFARFFQIADGSGKQVVDIISEMLEAYKYERDLSIYCQGKHVNKVVIVKDYGEEFVSGYPIAIVPYLIFDLAECDIRTKLNYSTNLEDSWKLKSLHSIATGLKQLHMADVFHQDLKPSNILLFGEESKIGDIGRSPCFQINSPYLNMPFAGEYTYAPPEILYGKIEQDSKRRAFSADCYLFGGLIVFYFSGVTINGLLRKQLTHDLSWENYKGTYDEIKDYVLDAYTHALDEFEASIQNEYLRKQLKELVYHLCHPHPEKRGHPKTLSFSKNQYDMERIVSQLDLLYRKVEYELLH